MTISTAIDLTWLEIEQSHAASSQSSYKAHARRFRHLWGGRQIAEISRRTLQEYVQNRRLAVQPATIHAEISFFNKVCRVAYDHGAQIDRPGAGLRLPPIRNKRKRALTEPEAARLKKALGPAWDIALFAIMTGLRRLEIFRLRPQDVHLWEVDRTPTPDGQGVITTRLGYVEIPDTKTGKARVQVLNPIAAAIAHRWMRGAGKWLLYPDRTAQRFVVAKNFSATVFRPAVAAAGVEDFTFHDLRHTSATWALVEGASLEDVQRYLDHETLAMTQRYVHLDQTALWPAAMALCRAGRLAHWPDCLPPAPTSSLSWARAAMSANCLVYAAA